MFKNIKNLFKKKEPTEELRVDDFVAPETGGGGAIGGGGATGASSEDDGFTDRVWGTATAPDYDYDPDGDITLDDLARIAEAQKKMDKKGVAVDFSAGALAALSTPEPESANAEPLPEPEPEPETKPDDLDGLEAELWALIQKDKATTRNVHALDEDISADFLINKESYEVVDGMVRGGVGSEATDGSEYDEDTTYLGDTEFFPIEGEMPPAVAEQLKALGIETVESLADMQKDMRRSRSFLLPVARFLVKRPIVIFASAAVVLLAAIAGLAYGAFYLVDTISREDYNAERARGTIIEQPDLGPFEYDKNYTYMQEANFLDDMVLSLQKMTQDLAGTTLYFNRRLDLRTYRVTLTDAAGHVYPPKAEFLNLASLSRTQTAVRFAPLPVGAAGFSVSVENRTTGETAAFKLRLDGGVKRVPTSYLSAPIKVGGGSLVIDALAVTSDMVTVTYSFRNDESSKTELYVKEKEPFSVTMTEGSGALKTALLPINKQPDLFTFEDGFTGGATRFSPPQSFETTLNVTFSDVYVRHRLDLDLQTTNLFTKGANRAQTLVIDDYGEQGLEVTLEGMQRQGSLFVLVAHSVDLAKPESEVDKYAGRVAAEIHAELIIEDGDDTYKLTGACRSDRRGADITFNADALPRSARTAPFENITLRLLSVSLKSPDVTVSINTGKLCSPITGEGIEGARAAIEKAIVRRLDYRCGFASRTSLMGAFDAESDSLNYMLNDRYAPIERIGGVTPINSAAAPVVCFDEETGVYYAVAYEYSDARDDSWVFRGTHLLTVKPDTRQFVILSDKLIE